MNGVGVCYIVCMEFRKFSEVVMEFENFQQSDCFVKMFCNVVCEGDIDVIEFKECFILFKQYYCCGVEGSYECDICDMVF